MSNLLSELEDDLSPYSEYDRDRYQELSYDEIEAVTPKAALIDGKWYPKSQLKIGIDDEIYVSNWFLERQE